ncbi:MAG: DUF5050 domain-containing protein [Clostridia bacterium]|nr:DUF5050 domain-containing protein [Clostridia bacterium]
MNRKTKGIIKRGLVALLILAIAAVVVFTRGTKDNTDYKAPVAAESVITGAEGYIYYNDTDNNICRRDIGSNKSYLIGENLTVLSAFMEDVLVSTGDAVYVVKCDGKATEEGYSVNTDRAEITADYIYYKDIETGYVMRIDRKTGVHEAFIKISADKFIVYGNKLIFTTPDRKMIYIYDMVTQMPMGYFGDKDIVDFDVDEDYLVYADAANGYKVSRMSLVSFAEDEIKGVKTKKMEYRNGKLFYVENHKKKSESYKLKIKDVDVH